MSEQDAGLFDLRDGLDGEPPAQVGRFGYGIRAIVGMPSMGPWVGSHPLWVLSSPPRRMWRAVCGEIQDSYCLACVLCDDIGILEVLTDTGCCGKPVSLAV